MNDRENVTYITFNCRNEECYKEIHVTNIHPELDFERIRKTIYLCSRECLELWLKDVGYVVTHYPEKEKTEDDKRN